MITTIYKNSPRERIRKKYGFNIPSYVEEKMYKEMIGAIYYKFIIELPKAKLVVDKDCELTKRVKYSRSTKEDGTKNKEVDIFIEISWELNVIARKYMFKENEYKKEKHTTWVPAEAFEFDFSDEIDEEIIDCA